MKIDLLSHEKILHVIKELEQNPALTQRELTQRFKKWITCDQGILRGKPVIKGTRISVELILRCMASGMTVEDILKGYPTLKKESVLAALHFAAGQMSIADKPKAIGRMVKPGKDRLSKISKKEAEIVDDTIKFHGAKLKVSVFNGYMSRIGKTGEEINIAADRIVSLKEGRIKVEISNYIASMVLEGRGKQKPIYGGFLWELPQKLLKKMPIILSYNKSGELVEIELLK